MMIDVPVAPYEEILDFFDKKEVVLPDEFYNQTPDELKSLSFSIAGLYKKDLIALVKESIKVALANGSTFKEWTKTQVAKNLGFSENRMDIVFRTNMQNSYNYGRIRSFEKTFDKKPFLMYDAVNDSRTRPAHAAMDGVIRRHDDSFWDTRMPANGYRCRCRVIQLSEKQAIARGGLDIKTTLSMKPDGGWSFNPTKTLSSSFENQK